MIALVWRQQDGQADVVRSTSLSTDMDPEIELPVPTPLVNRGLSSF